jgi:hypothetical protein
MAAGQHGDLVRQAAAREFVNEPPGEIDREGQVVLRVNEQRALVAHPIEVDDRADRPPQAAQLFEVDVTVQSFADVARRESEPDDVGKLR